MKSAITFLSNWKPSWQKAGQQAVIHLEVNALPLRVTPKSEIKIRMIVWSRYIFALEQPGQLRLLEPLFQDSLLGDSARPILLGACIRLTETILLAYALALVHQMRLPIF